MTVTAQTFAQKAIAKAAGRRWVEIGEIVDASPDIALSHDNSAAIRHIWQRFGRDRVRFPERLAITLDHAVPAPTPLHAQNHAEIRRFVAEQGIANFFEIGRGICHQVLSEEALLEPGQLILGADSHTPHFGWMGSFGAGIGRSEMAVVWATGELWLRTPESLRIELEGRLASWVSAKDIALHLIGSLGEDGGLYRCVEIRGPGVQELSLGGRMTLANMMAEMGAKASYLEPDEKVFRYLAERRVARRGATGTPTEVEEEEAALAASALYPDADASYAETHHFDVTTIRPQVACPHKVDNTVAVDELESIRVDQAFIGTCTNGRLEDLEVVHHLPAPRPCRHGHVPQGDRLHR